MSLRKDVEANQKFSIVIQTYNHVVKEIDVFPEMKIGELKSLIEEKFMVKKEYQELLYLVYKLNNDEKQLKDYYFRPKGIVFLRGFYFPIIFVDYYEKKNKNVLSINIAEQIQYIRDEIINRLNLEKDFKYQLIFNGKILEDENYLIDYNIQRMQTIYFK
jgi:hypothetical protein